MKKSQDNSYSDFINGLNINDIFLTDSEIHVDRDKLGEKKNTVNLLENYGLKKESKDGFTVSCKYEIKVKDNDESPLYIKVNFNAEYSSKIKIKKDYFNKFIKGNIQLNLFPYLREYVSHIRLRLFVIAPV